MDRLSIITTYYNAKEFILDAINSINQQEFEGFEVEYVLVNDKSTDDSYTLVKNFIDKAGNKKITFKLVEPDKNLGCGGARKFGIDNATGDFFMFLDADDYYMHKDFVNRAYHDIINEKADVVEYGILFNQQNGQQINNTAPQKVVIENNPSLAEIALFKDNLIKFNVWSKIYRRWVVESYPYSTVRTYEDVRTIPVWISNAKKIVIMPVTEINYRAAAGSIIRTNMIDTRLGTITAIAELFERYKSDMNVLKAMYGRAMVDLEAMLHNHSSNNPGFNEMSRLNTYMLSFIYPDSYKEKTFHIEDDKKQSVEKPSETQKNDNQQSLEQEKEQLKILTPDESFDDIEIE